MLTDDQKSEVRRHLGYPAASRGHLPYPYGQTELFRFNQESNFLEQRMDLLVPLDEAKITGEIIGVLSFVGPEPTTGAMFTIQITAADMLVSPVSIGPITFATGDTLRSMAAKLSQAVTMNATLASAQITAGGPYGAGFAAQDIPLPQVVFKAPKTFTFAITAMTGIGVAIQKQGTHVEPHLDGASVSCDSFASGSSGTIYGYLPILATLESLLLGTSARSHIARSGEYVRGNEPGERRALYNQYRRKLAEFMGVQMFDDSGSGGCSLLL